MKHYYDILELKQYASKEEIKSQYKKKAFETHPDRNNGDNNKFLEITEAYEALIKESTGPVTNKHEPFSPYNVEDLFYNKKTTPRCNKQRMPSSTEELIYVDIKISVQDIIQGKMGSVSYNIAETCATCNEEGGEDKSMCARCDGLGRLVHEVEQFGVRLKTEVNCTHCDGEGLHFSEKCVDCEGKGWKINTKKITFKIKVE